MLSGKLRKEAADVDRIYMLAAALVIAGFLSCGIYSATGTENSGMVIVASLVPFGPASLNAVRCRPPRYRSDRPITAINSDIF
jgi:hypothetical protein